MVLVWMKQDLITSIGTIAKSEQNHFVEALTGDAKKKIQTQLVNLELDSILYLW